MRTIALFLSIALASGCGGPKTLNELADYVKKETGVNFRDAPDPKNMTANWQSYGDSFWTADVKQHPSEQEAIKFMGSVRGDYVRYGSFTLRFSKYFDNQDDESHERELLRDLDKVKSFLSK